MIYSILVRAYYLVWIVGAAAIAVKGAAFVLGMLALGRIEVLNQERPDLACTRARAKDEIGKGAAASLLAVFRWLLVLVALWFVVGFPWSL